MKNKSKNLTARIGLVIRQRREDLGMTQASLAQLSRLNRNFIGMVERAERNLTVISLVAIAEALETTGHELLALAEEEDAS